MSFNENDIKESYTNALNRAKKTDATVIVGVSENDQSSIELDVTQINKDSSCCGSVSSTSSGDGSCCVPTDATKTDDQQISFGCVRLNDFLDQNLKAGDTVIDFGSGPGHDLFMAARIVGETGKAIGVDFTDAMIDEARAVAKEQGLTQVELVKASIDSVPLDDNIADFIISNCVINLAFDKQKVFDEAFRLLKPGGMLIDADVISDRPLNNEIQANNELWCSCVGGALTTNEYENQLNLAGFKEIKTEMGDKQNITFQATDFGIFSGVIFAKKPL